MNSDHPETYAQAVHKIFNGAIVIATAVLGILSAELVSARSDLPPAPSHPDFLVIVMDDPGFSDIGAFGGEISEHDDMRLIILVIASETKQPRAVTAPAGPALSPTRRVAGPARANI